MNKEALSLARQAFIQNSTGVEGAIATYLAAFASKGDDLVKQLRLMAKSQYKTIYWTELTIDLLNKAADALEAERARTR
mgnify:CR=1 FL=1